MSIYLLLSIVALLLMERFRFRSNELDSVCVVWVVLEKIVDNGALAALRLSTLAPVRWIGALPLSNNSEFLLLRIEALIAALLRLPCCASSCCCACSCCRGALLVVVVVLVRFVLGSYPVAQ